MYSSLCFWGRGGSCFGRTSLVRSSGLGVEAACNCVWWVVGGGDQMTGRTSSAEKNERAINDYKDKSP